MAGVFPRIRITDGDEQLELDHLMTAELKALERALNVPGAAEVWRLFEAGAAAAIEAFTWIARKRHDPHLRLDDVTGKIDLGRWNFEFVDRRGHVIEILPPREPGGQPRLKACLECIQADRAEEQAAPLDPTAAVTATAPSSGDAASPSPSDSPGTSC